MGGGEFSKDCCLQLAWLTYFSPIESCFFFFNFEHLPAKLYFAAIPIWVANTHFPFVEENVFFIAKNIFQTKHRSPTIFPMPVFSFCLSHTFITLVLIDILILYYSFLFYYASFMSMDKSYWHSGG